MTDNNWQTKARIIRNDLDSMVARIEDLPGHPKMTNALNFIHAAQASLEAAWGELHQQEIKERYDL